MFLAPSCHASDGSLVGAVANEADGSQRRERVARIAQSKLHHRCFPFCNANERFFSFTLNARLVGAVANEADGGQRRECVPGVTQCELEHGCSPFFL